MNHQSHSAIRCWTIFLLATICLACTTYDKHYAIYELWVGGVKVTTRNQSDILGDGSVRYEGSQQAGTLILTNANILDTADPDAEAVVVSNIPNLTLQLEGNNKIGMGAHTPVNAVSAYNLTITGDGSLAIGGRASCLKADTMIIEGGKIDAYIKTADSELATFLSVALWAQESMVINQGEVAVHYAASFSPVSYGLYCVKDLEINGGRVNINPEDSRMMAVGLIATGNLSITGGDVSVYGLDDAINARNTRISGGLVMAQSLDYFADGVCRLVEKAELTGGVLTICDLQRNLKSVKLFSNDLQLGHVQLLAGTHEANADRRTLENYGYTDPYIRIEKEE